MPPFENQEQRFLENDYCTFYDNVDTDEMRLYESGLEIGEMLYLNWMHGVWHDVVKIKKSKIIGIGGTHRSGKSVWAVTMGYIWDKTFWPRMKQRIIHTPQRFTQEIEYVRTHQIHGAVFVIDEGGVVVPSDSFYEEWYKVLNQAIQVIGYLNPIIIFCAVIRDNIGAKFRKLYNIQNKAKRFNNECSNIKIYELNYDDLKGKTWPKRPHMRIFGTKYILDSVKFGKPPKFIVDAYDDFSIPEKDRLLAKFNKTVTEAGNPEATTVKEEKAIVAQKNEREIFDKAVEMIVKNPSNYRTLTRSKSIHIDQSKIKMDLDCPVRFAEGIKREAERRLNPPKV